MLVHVISDLPGEWEKTSYKMKKGGGGCTNSCICVLKMASVSWSVCCAELNPEPYHGPLQVVEGRTANGRCTIRARVHALPPTLASALDENEATLRRVLVARSEETGEQPLQAGGGLPHLPKQPDALV